MDSVKFEIPLTNNDTYKVFDSLDKYGDYIKYVYAPPHKDDGGSGRPFFYGKTNKQEYQSLLREVNKIKPVIITTPDGASIEEYINIGIENFMVSYWCVELENLKNKYPNIKLARSIVGNAYNERVDTRFDSIIAPYTALTDKRVMKSISSQTSITVIPNHHCTFACHALDAHPAKSVYGVKATYYCPPGVTKNLFIPRELLLEILPMIDCVKLVDRSNPPEYYINYLRYYAGIDELQNLCITDTKNIETIKRYKTSNLKSGNCKFNCDRCNNKCFQYNIK